MNLRIQELLKQTGVTDNWNKADWYSMSPEMIEKFADMIVRECADILMKPEYVMNHPEELTDYNRGWVNGRLLGIEHIREHFGVAECT
jgi:acyl-CoA hydrolase